MNYTTQTTTREIRTLSDLLTELKKLDEVHICKFEIVKGCGWKCECGKTVKAN